MNAARSKRVVWVVNGRSHNRAERHVCNVYINVHVGGCATRFSKSLTGGRFYSHPYSLMYNFLTCTSYYTCHTANHAHARLPICQCHRQISIYFLPTNLRERPKVHSDACSR